MDQESIKRLEEIKERWTDNMKNVCESCMHDALRHWDRNMDPACNPKDNYEHPGRYDGDVYAYAGGDIKDLIAMIDELTNKIEIN